MKVLLCDLDKTLLPYGGIVLDEELREHMLRLQQNGMRIVLASARLSGGIFPVAQQLQMDTYGGFIIADNGSCIIDMQKHALWKGYEIPQHVCSSIIEYADMHDLHVSLEQGTYAVATGYDEGIAQDRENCGIDVILAQNVNDYIRHPIYKCSIAQSKDILDMHMPALKNMLHKDFDIYRSTDTFIDILQKGRSKEQAAKELLAHLKIPMECAVAIGDGDSDAYMIKEAGLGVTLENGTALCKQYADMIVPSCYGHGANALMKHLLQKI